MADVFISYAREDKDFVERLQKALKKDGREAWVDSEGILPSAEWLPEIFHAIEAAQAVLLVISPHSAASKVCSEEVAYATSQGKRIIPILRYEVDENLLPKPVRDRQWIFCRETDDFNSAIAALNSAIDTDLEWVRSHTRLLTHASEWDKHNRDPSFGLRGSDLREAETFLTTKDLKEPRLLPLQIEYILSSRKRANSRITFAMGAISFALVTTVILAALFWEKRQESALNLAANFREMGISELASDNPLAAELLFARALSIDPNNLVAKERLIEARARSPQSRWISQTSPESTVLASSEDGLFFATTSATELSIWSANARAKILTIPIGPKDQSATYSSVHAAFDAGDRLFAFAKGTTIEIRDLQLASGEPAEIFESAYEITSLSLSGDGSKLLAGTANALVLLWDLRNPQRPPREFSGHTDRVTSTAISPDGSFLVSASWDANAKVWNSSDERRSIITFSRHEDALLCVAISPDGRLVASAGWDNVIWIWDRSTGQSISALEGHRGSILTLTFSPDGKWLASGSEDRTARLWAVERGKHVLTLPGHAGSVTSVAFLHTTGEYELLTGDDTGVVRLWNISKIGQRDELVTLRGHNGGITTIAVSAAASLLVSSSVDKSIGVWDLTTDRLLKRIGGQEDSVSGVAISTDGKYIASVDKTPVLTLWDLPSDTFHILQEPEDGGKELRKVAISGAGPLVAAGDANGNIVIWNLINSSVVCLLHGHTAKIQGLVFSQSGALLASASEDSTIDIWQAPTCKLKQTLRGHRGGVYEISFSPDGRYLLSASDDKTARLWNVETGKELLHPIKHDSPVWAASFSPDGKTIATGTEDSTIQLWNVAINNDVATLENHTTLRISDGPVWWLDFFRSSTDQYLGIAGQDKTIRIFNLSRFRHMFSNPAELEAEASLRGGLMLNSEDPGKVQAVASTQDSN